MPRIDPAKLQGLVVNLYRYPYSRHLMFKVVDATRARGFLRTLLPRVTTGATDLTARPDPLVNIGVSWRGLAALGVIDAVGSAESAEAAFPAQFKDVPPDEMAGDWRGRLHPDDLHLTIHLHCTTTASLEQVSAEIRAAVTGGLEERGPVATGDPAITGATLGGAKLHFGFQDGISQPDVNWDDATNRPGSIDLRHVVLGYRTSDIQSSPSDGVWADFVRDGSYAAFQWIRQDVAAFEQYLTAAAPALNTGLPLAEARELLAARMMGRWRSGAPVALTPDHDDPALTMANAFGYAGDPQGLGCPLHAHIRLANRRDQPLDPPLEAVFPAGGPHVLRRGMAYGPELVGDKDDGVDRGLVGMFLCADLGKQFFIVMNWINKADFSPVFNPRRLRWQDMMMGDRQHAGSTAAAIQLGGREIELPPLPRFIDVRGTLLLLLPSLLGLQRMTQDAG